jgi:hypothetical protein
VRSAWPIGVWGWVERAGGGSRSSMFAWPMALVSCLCSGCGRTYAAVLACPLRCASRWSSLRWLRMRHIAQSVLINSNLDQCCCCTCTNTSLVATTKSQTPRHWDVIADRDLASGAHIASRSFNHTIVQRRNSDNNSITPRRESQQIAL